MTAILFASAALFAAAFAQAPSPAPQKAPAKTPRPIELKDILNWRTLGNMSLSADGRWLSYRVSPAEGDGEVIFKQTRGPKEYRFPAGEGRTGFVGLSRDARYGAFIVHPDSKDAKKLRQEKKRPALKAAVVNLDSGEKVEYDKIRSIQFSGRNPVWIALLKAVPESQDREKDKWLGGDLILRELGTGKEILFGNVSEFAFDKQGRWLAMLVDAYGQAGNGVLLRDMAGGAVVPLDNDKASYKSLGWNEKGTALACLKGIEDKAYEDKLYAVVGITGFGPAAPVKTTYDPKNDKGFPAGMSLSPDQAPRWTESLDALVFGIHELKKKDEGKGPGAGPEAAAPGAETDEDMPDLVLWHGADKRLQSQQQVESGEDQKYGYLAEFRIREKKFIRLADDEVRTVVVAPQARWAVGYDDREYELDGNLDGRSFRDVSVIDMTTGIRKPALKKSRYSFSISTDGSHLLYYEDGAFFTYEFMTGKSYPITKDVPSDFVNEDNDTNVKNPPNYPIGWSEDGKTVFLSDGYDIWSVGVHGGGAVNITVNGRKEQIRYRAIFQHDPELKGIDPAKPMYVPMYGEWTKKAGIGRIEKGKPGPAVLLWEDAGFAGPLKAENADVFVYTKDTYKDAPGLYATDATFKSGRLLTDTNPQQKDFLWSSGSILLDYKMNPKSGMDKKLQAALFLPANYEKGKRYPTIVYYYEKMSQQLNRYAAPSANGFNKSVYTSNGYAVLMPDITYKINDPGMSAAWCVLPALEAAAGVVDRSKVGLQGHSWGGYETAFLITQADFAAAVAGAPLTDMISMYSSIYF
ncbi:MAG: prolyl oligopeptidase family serine peptidase, partial [Candidatus Aminicenantales bacterium]